MDVEEESFFKMCTIIKTMAGEGGFTWLRLCTSITGGSGWIPGQETKIPNAAQCCQKNKIKTICFGTSLVVQWLKLGAPKAGGPGSIPSQGTGSHMPQLAQTWCSQILKKKKSMDFQTVLLI